MSHNTKKEHLDNISILRVFCILVVVFFHCYGMMYAESHFPNTVSIYHNLYYFPNQCIFIKIAMPLFVFISGYLFDFLLEKGKYPSWGNLLKKKGIRILLPYFVFGLFFMATTNSWHPLSLFNGGYWHLWFLPMLFWCFIAGYGIFKLRCSTWIELILLTIAFIGSLYKNNDFIPNWFGLHYLTSWFYYFYLGVIVYKYRNAISLLLGKYKLPIIMLLSSIFIICFFPVEYDDRTWYGNLAVTACIISINYLTNNINWQRYKTTPYILKFSAYSFGIYIWHNWVALILISKTSQRLFSLAALATNHTILFPLCFSIVTLVISLCLSSIMLKTKIGKFLIG